MSVYVIGTTTRGAVVEHERFANLSDAMHYLVQRVTPPAEDFEASYDVVVGEWETFWEYNYNNDNPERDPDKDTARMFAIRRPSYTAIRYGVAFDK